MNLRTNGDEKHSTDYPLCNECINCNLKAPQNVIVTILRWWNSQSQSGWTEGPTDHHKEAQLMQLRLCRFTTGAFVYAAKCVCD